MLDENYIRMIHVVLNKSWKDHSTKQKLCSPLPPILQTIQVRQTKYAEPCGKSKHELISNILLWTPIHRHTHTGQSATDIHQLCRHEVPSRGLLIIMDGERERVKWIHAFSVTSFLYHMYLLSFLYLVGFLCQWLVGGVISFFDK